MSVPHPATSQEEIELVNELFKLSSKSGKKLVKSTLHSAPADPQIKVRSWKMDEFKYYQVPSPFPTLARGLFTVKTEGTTEDEKSKHRIVIRGYDKFFNMGEVPWNTWKTLEQNTVPPYTLSLKSNGCIIFIGALTPTKIVVTSKHSLGNVDGSEGGVIAHAQAGEKWLRKYFADKGRTEAEFAATLWENNWTAVAELCDDNFEEHVLPYPPERTGLHLHGINTCTKAFHTLPHSTVDAFAEEWGFIKTLTHTVNTIAEVKKFTDEVSNQGEWMGEPVEGFVVRTHVGTNEPLNKREKPPYPAGSTFFFKVKFDEPYMMYRDWREVTRMLLSSKAGDLSPSSLPKSKMQRPETRVYVRWVIEEIKRDRKQFNGFAKGHGIIATRERFLKWLETEKGKKDLLKAQEKKDGATQDVEKGELSKTIIMPVAIPGCGKTTVAVALSNIFGFGHTQSDDVKSKKAAPAFLKNVNQELDKHDIVIADKNNHLRQHRQSLRDLASKRKPPARLVALQWPIHSLPQATVHRICADRVLVRGENHQALTSTPTSKSHEDVIWQFIGTSQELSPREVDDIIEMDLEEDVGLEGQIRRAIKGLVDILGLDMPSDDKIAKGVNAALKYAVDKKDKQQQKKKKEKGPLPRYFGILAEVDLKRLLDKALDGKDVTLWNTLKKSDRVVSRPHVTLSHSKELEKDPKAKEVWDRCMDVHSLPVCPLLEFKLGHIIWNDRVMAVTVDALRLAEDEGDDGLVKAMEKLGLKDTENAVKKGSELVQKLHQINDRFHITVGTQTNEIMPVEAKALVQAWRSGEAGEDVTALPLKDVVVRGRVKGLMS